MFRNHRCQQPLLQHAHEIGFQVAKGNPHAGLWLLVRDRCASLKKASFHKNLHQQRRPVRKRIGRLQITSVQADLADARGNPRRVRAFLGHLGGCVEGKPEGASSIVLHLACTWISAPILSSKRETRIAKKNGGPDIWARAPFPAAGAQAPNWSLVARGSIPSISPLG